MCKQLFIEIDAGGAPENIASGTIVVGADGLADQNVSSFPPTLTIGENAGHPIDLNQGSLTSAVRASQFTTTLTNGAAAGSLTGADIARNGRVTAVSLSGCTATSIRSRL